MMPHDSGEINKEAIILAVLSAIVYVPIDVWLKIITTIVVVSANIPNLFKAYDAIRERFKKDAK